MTRDQDGTTITDAHAHVIQSKQKYNMNWNELWNGMEFEQNGTERICFLSFQAEEQYDQISLRLGRIH